MVPASSKSYSLRVHCPYGDYDDWISLHGRTESLEFLSSTVCSFECPTHGLQSGFPLEVVERNSSASPAQTTSPPSAKEAAAKKPRRSGERKPYHVPVVVYGWSKSAGSFHENSTTIKFNASGALVKIVSRVDLGEKLFLVNKFTREEQEVRVVFIDPLSTGGCEVGLAFAGPIPNFWRKTRRSQRSPESLRVIIRGQDRRGNPFAQSSHTLDISEDGARLDNVAYLTSPGQIIEVKRRWHGKARFRVAWIGQLGSSESNQIGICTLESGKLPWKSKLPPPKSSKPSKKS